MNIKEVLTKIKWTIKIQQYNLNKEVIFELVPKFENRGKKFLDIGCNDGVYSQRIAQKARIELSDCFGVDYNPEANPPFNFAVLDLEEGKLPYGSSFFDLVIADQILEHLKNIGKLMDEVNRTMKVGGTFIVSVPNLAALPNRLLLLFGRMPLAIQGMEHHIRGFTPNAIREFIEEKGYRVTEIRGGGFYPGPKFLSRLLQKLFPFSSHFICLKAEKVDDITDNRSKEKHFHITRLSPNDSQMKN